MDLRKEFPVENFAEFLVELIVEFQVEHLEKFSLDHLVPFLLKNIPRIIPVELLQEFWVKLVENSRCNF